MIRTREDQMKTGAREGLSPALLERVLTGLGIAARPEPTWHGLNNSMLPGAPGYRSTMRKLIHLRSGERGALPGDTPAEFFEAWLRHGTGGTCWAGNGALARAAGAGFRGRARAGDHAGGAEPAAQSRHCRGHLRAPALSRRCVHIARRTVAARGTRAHRDRASCLGRAMQCAGGPVVHSLAAFAPGRWRGLPHRGATGEPAEFS